MKKAQWKQRAHQLSGSTKRVDALSYIVIRDSDNYDNFEIIEVDNDEAKHVHERIKVFSNDWLNNKDRCQSKVANVFDYIKIQLELEGIWYVQEAYLNVVDIL